MSDRRKTPMGVDRKVLVKRKSSIFFDTLLYFTISFLLSYPFYYLLTFTVVGQSLQSYIFFGYLFFAQVVSSVVGAYIASFPTVKIISWSYDASPFITWYGSTHTNILRIILSSAFNSAIYVYAFVPLMSYLFFGNMDFSSTIIAYFVIRFFSEIISHSIADNLTRATNKGAESWGKKGEKRSTKKPLPKK